MGMLQGLQARARWACGRCCPSLGFWSRSLRRLWASVLGGALPVPEASLTVSSVSPPPLFVPAEEGRGCPPDPRRLGTPGGAGERAGRVAGLGQEEVGPGSGQRAFVREAGSALLIRGWQIVWAVSELGFLWARVAPASGRASRFLSGRVVWAQLPGCPRWLWLWLAPHPVCASVSSPTPGHLRVAAHLGTVAQAHLGWHAGGCCSQGQAHVAAGQVQIWVSWAWGG